MCVSLSRSPKMCFSAPFVEEAGSPLFATPADYIEVSCNAMFGNGLFETNAPPDMNRFYTASHPLHDASTQFTLPGGSRRLIFHSSARSSRVQTSSSREWRHGVCCGISGALMTAVLARQPRSPRLTAQLCRVLKDLARSLPERSPLGVKCFEVANGESRVDFLPRVPPEVLLTFSRLARQAIMNVFRYDDLSTIAASRKLAAEVFGGPEWEKEAHKVYGKDPVADGVASYAIGNCHVSLGRSPPVRHSSTYHLQSSLGWHRSIRLGW